MIGKRRELGMFRTFSGLEARSLLYMQAELLQIESDMEAFVSLPEMDPFDRSFLYAEEKEASDDAVIWRAKFVELREKLSVYCEMMYHLRFYHVSTNMNVDDTLLQVAAVNSLSKPHLSDLQFLRKWIDHRCGGDSFLSAIEGGPWKDPGTKDLILLSGDNQPGDRLAEALSSTIIPIYHRLIGRRLHRTVEDVDFAAVWEYKKEALDLFGNILCMFLSASVPTLSIFALYFLQSMVARLAAIMIFSLLFSWMMTFVVEGRRSDVWAATTAFAAVLVVFIGVGSS